MNSVYESSEDLNFIFRIHDKECLGWVFSYNNKELTLKLFDEQTNIRWIIVFFNVLVHEVITCDTWGASPYIYNWSYVNDNDQTKHNRINYMNKEDESIIIYSTDKNEFVITFASGDTMKILCDKVLIRKE